MEQYWVSGQMAYAAHMVASLNFQGISRHKEVINFTMHEYMFTYPLPKQVFELSYRLD